MLRSCLRAVESISHIPGVEAHAAFQKFLTLTVLKPPLKERYAAIAAERAGVPSAVADVGHGDAMDLS